MKHQTLICKHRKSILATSLFTICMVPIDALSNENLTYEFNSSFIVGSKENVDLSRFNYSGIGPGKYSVDVYTNNNWKGRYELNFGEQDNGQLSVCYTPEMLSDFGINFEKLNTIINYDSNDCLPLKDWNNEKDVIDTFHSSTLRLDIYVPQIFEQRTYRGYVSPLFWETGIPALNVGYMANYYDNHTSGSQGTNNANAYLSLNAGLSYDGWLLKHIGNFNWQSHGGINWSSNQSYLQKPIVALKSKATAGRFNTNGDLFVSISLRGAKLATDDNMYPDGMLAYAPEIRGVAQSNALITVKQNGSIIYQTTVFPGPFSLTDIYSSGYGNDLVVTVKEADGSETSFSVPYSSLAQLLRPGFTRYQVAGGKADADGLKNRPFIMQGTIQHGLNNTFTLYSGVTVFDDYQTYLVGSGVNSGFGAIAVDLTQSRTVFKDRDETGKSYRLTFSRLFAQTDTNLVLSAYRHSTNGYYDVNHALYAIDNDKRDRRNVIDREKKGFSYTINQNFPDGYGGIYFTGRISNYWDKTWTEKQYQLSYNNNYNHLSYGITFMRVYTENTNNKDDRISLNLSYPLYFGGRQSTTLTSNTTFNSDKFGSTRVGASGAFDRDNNWIYSINTSVENSRKKNIFLHTGYRSALANTSSTYSQGQEYRQVGLGANGSVIVHTGGVTLTPYNSTTFALIEAENAEGAFIAGAPGTRIDRNGYAVTPNVRAYRINNIEIDPKGSSNDIVFENTLTQVVPYEGSIVKVKFGTKVEKNIAFNVVRQSDKPLPFGVNVTDKDGNLLGIVGQGGTVFISKETAKEAFIKWAGGQCSFSLEESNSKDVLCQ